MNMKQIVAMSADEVAEAHAAAMSQLTSEDQSKVMEDPTPSIDDSKAVRWAKALHRRSLELNGIIFPTDENGIFHHPV
jgi:hypothetical protein